MGFWGTYIVGRSEQALAELPALAPAADDVVWQGFGQDGWQCLRVHYGPDGWDSRDLPGAWEATLRALMEQTGHPVLAAAVLDSDGCQLIGYGPESGRWGGWLMLDRIIGHFDPEARPQVTLGEVDEDGYPTSVEYEDEESVRPRYEAAVARLTVAAGPPGSLAAPAALGWAAEAGLHPSPSAVAAVMDDRDVFAEDHFFTFLTTLGVPGFTAR